VCAQASKSPNTHTGWRRLIGCLKLQVVFCKRATNYRALLRKMTYKDKPSYASSPPCTQIHKHATCFSLLQCVAVCLQFVCGVLQVCCILPSAFEFTNMHAHRERATRPEAVHQLHLRINVRVYVIYMYGFMYALIHVCMYVCVCACILHVYVYIGLCIGIYVSKYVCIHIHTHTKIYVHTYVHTYLKLKRRECHSIQ